jgi:septum formation protein
MNSSGQAGLVLASRSPRRVQILGMLGFAFEARSPDFEEIVPEGMAAAEAPEYLARGKALSLPPPGGDVFVLGSDTVVILDGRLMGKPSGPEEALEMLTALNGRTHTVITGVALARNGRILESGAASTAVTFARTDAADLRAYAGSGEPLDKAGAYAIQGRGAALVEKVDGCFYNVMGLPVQLTLRLLAPHFKATKAEAK